MQNRFDVEHFSDDFKKAVEENEHSLDVAFGKDNWSFVEEEQSSNGTYNAASGWFIEEVNGYGQFFGEENFLRAQMQIVIIEAIDAKSKSTTNREYRVGGFIDSRDRVFRLQV